MTEFNELPDGSGFGVISLPLPRTHWSTVDPTGINTPPMPLRLGTDAPNHAELVRDITAAGRYAYRAATMNGRETSLDPDALMQAFVVGLIGYHTPDGRLHETWATTPSSATLSPRP